MVVDNSGCGTELHRIARCGRSRQVSLSRRAKPHVWTWLRRERGIAHQHPNPAEFEGNHPQRAQLKKHLAGLCGWHGPEQVCLDLRP